MLLPSLPGPGQPSPYSSQGFGRARLPKLSAPAPSGRQVCSAFSATPGSAHVPLPTESPWGTKPAAEPYLSHLGPWPQNLVPGLSVFIASIHIVLWTSWPAGSQCHHPQAGPPWTQPGQTWDQVRTQLGADSCASPPPPWSPSGVCQAQALTGRGACPCFYSDREINTPEGVGSLLLVLEVWKRWQGACRGEILHQGPLYKPEVLQLLSPSYSEK